MARWKGGLATLLVAAGCSPVFNVRAAHEVSRDRLIELADQGRTNHLRYMGSDGAYHYVFDSRQDSKRSYKVRADEVKLKDTFDLNQDHEPYVLWPWVIEGQTMGSPPQEMPESAFPAEARVSDAPASAAAKSKAPANPGWRPPAAPAMSSGETRSDP